MDRGAWQATVHGVAESGVTEVTPQACTRLVNMIWGGDAAGPLNF